MKLKNTLIILGILFLIACTKQKHEHQTEQGFYPITGVSFNEVHINDQFWLPKIEINRTATIPAAFKKCEEMGRLDNFLIAGGKMEGPVKGDMPFDDTDVYKTIEGASYSLTNIPDPKLESYVDSLIEIIATGQEKDGYLTTYKTIDTTHAPAAWCPAGGRWQNLECSHELYNSGHLFEAATAHHLATGKNSFLNIALKNADLLVSVFGKEGNNQVPGHQIVETGLIKLYLITKNESYLKLARHFMDIRGDSTKRKLWGPYNQDHEPVTQQKEAVGHAVRALYMYAGMTDIAALYKDSAYTNAVDNLWENVVYKKMYLTGGLGSQHNGEAFGENYELPNLARLMPSVAGYIYAHCKNELYINLFVQSSSEIQLENTSVKIEQTTRYPWEGTVQLKVNPEKQSAFTLKLRIPGWAVNQPVPGDLYTSENSGLNKPVIKINGTETTCETENGFAVIAREWNPGDEIEYILPMDVRKIKANNLVTENRGKVALERGPLVYCLEEIDNPDIDLIQVSKNTSFSTRFDGELLNGIEVIEATGENKYGQFKAVPYYIWNNRGANKMNVWLTEKGN